MQLHARREAVEDHDHGIGRVERVQSVGNVLALIRAGRRAGAIDLDRGNARDRGLIEAEPRSGVARQRRDAVGILAVHRRCVAKRLPATVEVTLGRAVLVLAVAVGPLRRAGLRVLRPAVAQAVVAQRVAGLGRRVRGLR